VQTKEQVNKISYSFKQPPPAT